MILCAAGCEYRPKYITKPYSAARLIAVLPLANYTNDMAGPDLVRRFVFRHLRRRGYSVIPLDIVDTRLREVGITDGGALGAITAQELGAHLNCDGLMYGELLQFSYVTLGFYNKRAVELRLAIVDSRTGERIWEDDKKEVKLRIETKWKDATRAFTQELGGKAVESLFRSPLAEESETVVIRIMRTLPLR